MITLGELIELKSNKTALRIVRMMLEEDIEPNPQNEPLSIEAKIVAVARAWLDTPYQHQASLKGVGCDCAGLVRGVWRELYGQEPLKIPPYTPNFTENSTNEVFKALADQVFQPIPLEEIQPGDMVLFRWKEGNVAKHCGILTSPTTFIHAHERACVAEVTLSNWWKRHLAYAFRFPPQTLT